MMLRLLPASLAIALVASCYQQDTTAYSTLPEPPMAYSGPPGGGIDPGWQQGYYDPQQPGYPQGYPSGYAEGYPPGYPAGSEDVAAMQTDGELTASADPNADGYVMGAPTDGDIDATLDGYGEWESVDGYGEVWRPYATVVGLDFTPYESCGTWVWTDWGWTFACEWDWGWLPFHYGRWGWFGDAWAWQPGYDWSPGWVDWRSGGDYCGWRPSPPAQSTGPIVRDHRKHQGAWSVADGTPPTLMDSHWRFQKVKDFGKRIRPNLMKNAAEGLASTSIVTRPPFKATTRPLDAASVMHGRLPLLAARHAGTRVGPGNRRYPQQQTQMGHPYYGPRTLPPPRRIPPAYDRRTPSPDAIDRLWPHAPAQAADNPRAPSGGWTPSRPDAAVRPSEPSRPATSSSTWSPPRAPSPTQPPRTSPSPSPTWTSPSHPSPPSNSGWSPSHSSSSSSGSSGGFSPSHSSGGFSSPSHSSGSSGGGSSSSHSSGGGGGFSHGGGGGGHRR